MGWSRESIPASGFSEAGGWCAPGGSGKESRVYHASMAGLAAPPARARPLYTRRTMAAADDPPVSEREQTDESLRGEREKVDLALDDPLNDAVSATVATRSGFL